MTQGEVWLLVGLFGATMPLVAIARRANIPYPIVLVIGGLILGFVPGLPQIALDPNLVLVLFLPPLLYWEAITAPTDVMRANAVPIWILVIGLVLATAGAVAFVVHAIVPNLAWAMAVVLGAIVAPTDELASAPTLDRLRIPRRLIAIVEGESLLNDATSLILYTSALAAVVTGVFNLWQGVAQFFIAGIGAVLLGFAVGWLAVEGWRRIKDTQLQSVISCVLPFLTYLLADRLELSGVLAVVFMGLYANRFTPSVMTPTARMQLTGYYETIVFLANAVLFLLVGLQLHQISSSALTEYSWQQLLWYAFAVNVTVVGVRFVWLLLQARLPNARQMMVNWKHALIAAWSGLRGSVSLAAALAIPMSVASGAHLPHRDLVIFLTFSVILVTLVGGGLTLPSLIRRLHLPVGTSESEEVRHATATMYAAALDKVEEMQRAGTISGRVADDLRWHYQALRTAADGQATDGVLSHLNAEREALSAARQALIASRGRGEIDNTVLRQLQHTLDVAEARVADVTEINDPA